MLAAGCPCWCSCVRRLIAQRPSSARRQLVSATYAVARRLHDRDQRRDDGRTRRARAVLQRDDRRACPGAGRAAGPARNPRAAGRGSDGGAQRGPGAAGAVEKLSSLGRLAASIAHEINNPWRHPDVRETAHKDARIGGVDEPTRATSVKHLKLVQRETERCTAIVRNLLDFARQRPLSLKDTDVVAVLEEAVSLVGHQRPSRG